ncbi:hybrid sensor histidine kinase/response regulator [Phormidium sp. CCY1219]|uniref:hybrid sensor histidine kinase/response regulator n=1 Tax=Phormidium sp. CCY1219 TaxID=2886104 RepID=UPI002D1EE383|nr:hybrid sensor histidine kinase/response regulator [Phormidium sp. CCY1219]MEB3827648.1 hybrid sensor histidine kinase/response regulator [Phormidium sp. CCY1219]
MINGDRLKILLVEDDLGDADFLCELLEVVEELQCEVTRVQRLQGAIAQLSEETFDVVLLDLSLPDSYGLQTLSQLYPRSPQTPIVILSGLEDQTVAIQAVQNGAQDYLVKGQFDGNLLGRSIRYAIEREKILHLLEKKEDELEQANQALENRVKQRTKALEEANDKLRIVEAQLRESLAQEKELSELKSRIITTISHEYRTPLTTIASSTELLQIYSHKWDNSKQERHFQNILRAVERMTELVEEVLFVNQAQLENLEIQRSPIQVREFFQEILEEQQVTVGDKYSLNLTAEGEYSEGWLDGNLLRQIAVNLLSNAIKYSPEGGRIEWRLNCDRDCLRFQVKDEGIGIPESDKPYLFESFRRANNVGNIPGTGLGLSIVKKCVELHNGEIFLRSTQGKGTTVTVILPTVNPEKTAAEG